MTSFFSADGGPIWIKFRRLVQNDMSTMRWCVEIETRCRIPIWRTFGWIHWHVIPEPRITLQGAATWWIHCHDSRATCHIAGCKNSIRHIENRFRHILFVFNAVKALTSGGFRIVSDTLNWAVMLRSQFHRRNLSLYRLSPKIVMQRDIIAFS